nr:ribonuclease 1-like [Ipomoea batatas]
MKLFHCFLLLTTLSLASLSTIAFTADIKPDYFFISLKWPKTQCKSKEGCCLPKKGSPSLNDFVIHEFQAFYSSNGGTIANCTTGTKFQPSKIADLVPSLQKYWPSLSCPSRDSKKLWKEEWVEYGTCAETLFNQHDYFAAALRVYKQINLFKVLADAGIKPNGTYYPGEAINKAIAKAGLGEITVSCREDEKGVNAVLDYITLCASNKEHCSPMRWWLTLLCALSFGCCWEKNTWQSARWWRAWQSWLDVLTCIVSVLCSDRRKNVGVFVFSRVGWSFRCLQWRLPGDLACVPISGVEVFFGCFGFFGDDASLFARCRRSLLCSPGEETACMVQSLLDDVHGCRSWAHLATGMLTGIAAGALAGVVWMAAGGLGNGCIDYIVSIMAARAKEAK